MCAGSNPRVDSHGNTSLRLAAPCGAPDPFMGTAGCLPNHLAAWLHAAGGPARGSAPRSPGRLRGDYAVKDTNVSAGLLGSSRLGSGGHIRRA